MAGRNIKSKAKKVIKQIWSKPTTGLRGLQVWSKTKKGEWEKHNVYMYAVPALKAAHEFKLKGHKIKIVDRNTGKVWVSDSKLRIALKASRVYRKVKI